MNCEQAGLLFEQALTEPDGAERRRVMQHLSTCESCRHAFRALAYLRAERDRPVPAPSPRAADDALEAATADGARHRAGSFWSGVVVGAMAAGLAALAIVLLPADRMPGRAAGAPPEVTMAVHEPEDVSIAIDSAQALSGAEIHVSLHGAVDLRGFAGQRDIRWTTDLEPGINELRLPVEATGERGGQVRVVVRHGNRQKTFTIDVHVAEPDAAPSV